MSAPALHLHHFDGIVVNGVAFSIFDQDDNLVIDCAASGMSKDYARRIVASWNSMRHLTVEQIEAVANGAAQLEVV